MMHESDTSHDSTDHEMSIVDDHENGTTKESILELKHCTEVHFASFPSDGLNVIISHSSKKI